jgi:hypothetical protein
MQTIREYIKEIGDKKFKKQLTDLGKQQIKYPNWIITDCRFENELKAVKERDGITIRVQRPEYCPNCPMEDLTSQDCGDCAVYQHEIYPSLHESILIKHNIL